MTTYLGTLDIDVPYGTKGKFTGKRYGVLLEVKFPTCVKWCHQDNLQ